jgi:hypothetical protein
MPVVVTALLLALALAGPARAFETACQTSFDCQDGNACTADACVDHVCQHVLDPECTSCTGDADCDDADGCTADVCDAGACRHDAEPSCTACVDDAGCDDGDPCTDDACGAGACTHVASAACTACTTDADCADADACTIDACGDGGTCLHAADPACDGGGTFSGDGGVPSPAAETCDNCTDDDGDGLVDAADPDCCPVRLPLALALPRARASQDGSRVALRLLLPAGVAVGGDLGVQLGDGDAMATCSVVPAEAWSVRGRSRQARVEGVRTAARAAARGRTVLRAVVPGAPQLLAAAAPELVVRTGDVCLRGRVSLRGIAPVHVAP